MLGPRTELSAIFSRRAERRTNILAFSGAAGGAETVAVCRLTFVLVDLGVASKFGTEPGKSVCGMSETTGIGPNKERGTSVASEIGSEVRLGSETFKVGEAVAVWLASVVGMALLSTGTVASSRTTKPDIVKNGWYSIGL
jgi:hypothetical protein